MEREIKKIGLRQTTDTCPVCGYTDGFHVSFKEHIDRMRIILICPECHSKFDPTWEIKREIEQTTDRFSI